jgi:hypothetical protein
MSTKRKADDAATVATAKPRRRRVKLQLGQILAIPLCDGSFGLAHIAAVSPLITCAVFSVRRTQAVELPAELERALDGGPVAVMMVTPNFVTDGSWPVIGQRAPSYSAHLLDTKGRSATAGCLEDLLNAYHGLQPWDGMGDPRCFEKDMLPGVPVPPSVRYKRDFERDAATQAVAVTNTAATQPGAEQAITQGPGVIHIEIKYPGDDLPSMPLLKRRQAIESGLEAAGVGEVTDAGGGGGVMDIFLETNDVARALPFVHAAIKEAGFENDARIEVEPLSADDEEENDDPEEQDGT